MELQEFISKAVSDIVNATNEANSVSDRDIQLASVDTSRTIEFDIAVSAEEKVEGSGKGGIKVLGFIEAGGGISKEVVNSTVSRIRFGMNVGTQTKAQDAADRASQMQAVERARERNHLNSAK